MYYAIEIIGQGKRSRYTIKQVTPGRGTAPVDGRTYRTEEQARDAARILGIQIERVGDLWEII